MLQRIEISTVTFQHGEWSDAASHALLHAHANAYLYCLKGCNGGISDVIDELFSEMMSQIVCRPRILGNTTPLRNDASRVVPLPPTRRLARHALSSSNEKGENETKLEKERDPAGPQKQPGPGREIKKTSGRARRRNRKTAPKFEIEERSEDLPEKWITAAAR